MQNNVISCTIYDCEGQLYVKGVILSNIIYAIGDDGSYIPPKNAIDEHVDYGMVQFYIGTFYYAEYYFFGNNNATEENCNSKWGYFDIDTGEILVAPEYEHAGTFYGDRAYVKKNGKVGYIDYNGKIVIDIIWDQVYKGNEFWIWDGETHILKSEPWVVRKNNKWGYINRDGKIIIPLIFDYACKFEENRAEIKIGNKYGYINTNGDIVIEPVYDEVEPFKCIGKDDSNNYYAARVKKDDLYGFVDENGKYIAEPMFKEAFEFWDLGYAGVKVNDKWSVINRKGEFLVESRFDDIGQYYGELGGYPLAGRRWGRKKDGYYQQTLYTENIKNVYFTVKLNGEWGIMDSDFNVMMPEPDTRFVIFNGSKIYIRDGNVTSCRRFKPKSIKK